MIRIAWSEMYAHPLPEGHRFPMEKYTLIPEQLLYEGSIREQQLFLPAGLVDDQIFRTHSAVWWSRLKTASLTPIEVRRTGFPVSEQLALRENVICSGTWECVAHAFRDGVALNISGGTHHAFYDRGEGFCLLNDVAIAANLALDAGIAKRILVIDLDVHQGNGTAALFNNEPRVFTFSMHAEANYPMIKERSSLDIGLPAGIQDEAYLDILRQVLPGLFDKVMPELVFYLGGVDILETDKLGRLAVTRKGCMTRDQFVFEYCKRHHVPVVTVMGGGYSTHVRDIVEAHCNTFRAALDIFS